MPVTCIVRLYCSDCGSHQDVEVTEVNTVHVVSLLRARESAKQNGFVTVVRNNEHIDLCEVCKEQTVEQEWEAF